LRRGGFVKGAGLPGFWGRPAGGRALCVPQFQIAWHDPGWLRGGGDARKSLALLGLHFGPALGLVFYTSTQFPAEYRNNAFVAIHGSGPLDRPDGYKVVRVPFKDGKPVGGYEDFATGFFRYTGGKVSMWGSPSQLAVAIDGSLLFVDDKNNCVWRVAYKGNLTAAILTSSHTDIRAKIRAVYTRHFSTGACDARR